MLPLCGAIHDIRAGGYKGGGGQVWHPPASIGFAPLARSANLPPRPVPTTPHTLPFLLYCNFWVAFPISSSHISVLGDTCLGTFSLWVLTIGPLCNWYTVVSLVANAVGCCHCMDFCKKTCFLMPWLAAVVKRDIKGTYSSHSPEAAQFLCKGVPPCKAEGHRMITTPCTFSGRVFKKVGIKYIEGE